MDIKQLATDVTVFLTPFLPYLILAGEATAKKIGEKFGEATLEKAKSLWSKIQNFTKDNAKIQRVATTLAEDPDDEDFQVALAKLLVKQFETSPELTNELLQIMKDDKAVQMIIVERESKVRNISQRLSKSGTQEVTIRDKSQAGNINQEM